MSAACCEHEPEVERAEFCSVVLDNCCTAPPGVEGRDPRTRGRCYSCGEAVCPSCSTIRLYDGGKRRICATCEQWRFEDGEARILVRLHHRAGYPDYTLASARRQLAAEAAMRQRLTVSAA